MNEMEFAGVIKRGLGEPAESPRLNAAITRAVLDGRRRRPRRRFAVLIAAAALVPTAAVAAAVLTPRDVETGMPAATLAFTGTDPKCTSVVNGVEYRCVLSHAPTVDVTGPHYLGTKELLAGPDSTINGGCVATSDNGLLWECYIGNAAVQHDILSAQLLGQKLKGPSVG